MSIKVKIDNIPVTFNDQQPRIVNGSTLVPVQPVFLLLGYNINWIPGVGSQPKGTLRLWNTDNLIEIKESENRFTVNGKPFYHTNGVPAQVIGGRIMIPIRSVLESIGCFVGWDNTTETVLVNTYMNNLEGYFKIKNSNGQYLTYISPPKNDDPISVASGNNSSTQIWKIEASTIANKYHIKPAQRNSHAMNIYRSDSYPCTIYATSNNIEDTSFSFVSTQGNNYAIKWEGETETRYLINSGSNTYWSQTNSSTRWILEPANYTPSEEGYLVWVKDKKTGSPIQGAKVYSAPNKFDKSIKGPDFDYVTTNSDGRATIPSAGWDPNLNYASIGIIVEAEGYADWISESGTLAPSSDLIIAEMTLKSEYPNYSLPLNVGGPIRTAHRDFGWRYLNPLDYHTGIDIGGPSTEDKVVRSICNGTVVKNEFMRNAGNYITVKSDEGYYVSYLHLASANDFMADVNGRIMKGAKIGIMSNTNIDPNPANSQNMVIHLHISIGIENTISTAARTYIDPKAFLTF